MTMLESMSISKVVLRSLEALQFLTHRLVNEPANQRLWMLLADLTHVHSGIAPKVQRPPKSPESTNAASFKVPGQILAQVQPSTNRAGLKLDCRPRFLDKMWDWNTKSFINELGVPS